MYIMYIIYTVNPLTGVETKIQIVCMVARKQAGRHACLNGGIQPGWQASRQASRQASSSAGRWAGRQCRQMGRFLQIPYCFLNENHWILALKPPRPDSFKFLIVFLMKINGFWLWRLPGQIPSNSLLLS